MKGIFILGLCAGPAVFYAQIQKDSISESQIQEVKLIKRLPVAREIISVQKDLDQKNLGQDLPVLLKNQTSVVTTSDAGNGIGYTGFRIRGVGGTAINVMMNGVPYNDSESQGTFFVDVPDLASSASQIVIQRGVGSSSNGVSAFGASVNVISKDPEEHFYLKTDDSYGSFNTNKYSAEIGSGKFWDNKLSLMGRYTGIHSDGYIDRAFSDLHSYNFSALFEQNKTKLRFLAFGGKEKTYQAWNGIAKNTWETNPKYNSAGSYFDAITGEQKFYDNHTDNYTQNHYQLLWSQGINDRWNLETTLHYTKGKGYYESIEPVDENDDRAPKYATFGLQVPLINGVPLTRTDLVSKEWLDNDFYGVVSTLYGRLDNVDFNFGVVGNQYFGRHFGQFKGLQLTQYQDLEYYRNRSVKNEISGFAKAVLKVNAVEFFGDLQLRNITYDTKILRDGAGEGGILDKKWTFFNPKAGVSYRIAQGKVFLSYALAHREPTRNDLMANPDTQAEKLHDFEAGLEKSFGNFQFSANAYYMNYMNQLVLTGEINNVGAFIRANSGKSYRTGIELAARTDIANLVELNGNVTFSQNKNRDFKVETNKVIHNYGDTTISFSPNITANLGLNIKPAENFSFGIQNQFVGKQYLDNTENESLALDSYFLTDLHVKYSISFRHTDVDFKFLLNNLFNKKYVSNGYVNEGTPYVYAQAGTNFMFGMSLKFR